MKQKIKKIALLGPESTGKTELCIGLAKYFHTEWVPEFARDYIGSLEKRYTLKDVLHCVNEQLKLEQQKEVNANEFLFCDTELINFKVWCLDVFNTLPAQIEKLLSQHQYDFHLLTYPDMPFVADNVRENPSRREFFFEWYKRELEESKFPYAVIKGNGKLRLENAVAAIEKYFSAR